MCMSYTLPGDHTFCAEVKTLAEFRKPKRNQAATYKSLRSAEMFSEKITFPL